MRGPALPVVRQMGVVPQLRSATTGVTAMRLIDRHGRPGGRVRMPSGEFEVGPAGHPGEALMYNTPGRLVSVHPAGHRRRTDPRRRVARLSAALVVPRTGAGLAIRNAAARLLLPARQSAHVDV